MSPIAQRFIFSFSLLMAFCFSGCSSGHSESDNVITILEMDLSAFGVESDDFPSIHAYIDFRNDSSLCQKSYFGPETKGASYKLTHEEIRRIFELLQHADLSILKNKYTTSRTDQPTSTTKIYNGEQTIVVEDYGLVADKPLPEIYKIVYKF